VRSLGFRCYKDALVHVALTDMSGSIEVSEEKHTQMPDLDRPHQLVWLRKEVCEILTRVQPDVVAYKAAEPNAQAKDLGRAEAEGVLQEACQSSGRTPVRRLKRQIKADLHFGGSAANVADALAGTSLETIKPVAREAALVAYAALVH